MKKKNIIDDLGTTTVDNVGNKEELFPEPLFDDEKIKTSEVVKKDTSIEEVQDEFIVEDEFIVKDDDIQHKKGNYIFTVGNVSSGKSTLQKLMIHRLWKRADISFKYINENGDKRHDAILNEWVKEIEKKNLPARTPQGEIQEFSISFGQNKTLELNFLEISGEDIRHIVPTLKSKEVKGLHQQLDEYLKLKQITKRFIFVSDSSVNRKKTTSNNSDENLSEDILFNHLLTHLLGENGLRLKKLEILFVVAKWDIVSNEYKSVEEYIKKNFPQTRSILREQQCKTVYIPFSIGKIAQVKNPQTHREEEKIISLESEYVDRLIHWIYITYNHTTLKKFPKVVPTFFDKIIKVLRIS